MTRHSARPTTLLALLALAAGACAGRGPAETRRTTSPARMGDCIETCVVEVENRTQHQLEVVLRDGLSVRTLGAVSGYQTESFELPPGLRPPNVGARLGPGAASGTGGRGLVCNLRNRGAELPARLVCDLNRG